MSQLQVNSIYKVTDTHIYGFFKEHKFLSNFEVCEVEYEGIIYPSSEAAYQAAKVLEDEDKRMEFTRYNPSEARKKGQAIKLREDWKEVRDEIMETILIDKFTRHLNLRDKLLATGDKYLEETNWWGDRYWGVFMGQGENNLGKILMKIRENLTTKP